MKVAHLFTTGLVIVSWLSLIEAPVLANIPGGGTGTGPSVTLSYNAGTATMGNGIVTVVCSTGSATLTSINYTYNNSGAPVTNPLLSGGKDGGEFYWETGGFGSGTFTYSPVANTTNYCEFDLLSTSATNGTMDVRFSMLRGSPGFYVTATWSHRNGDGAFGMGETRDNIYLNPEFSWNSIDAAHNFQYNVGGAGGGNGTPGQVPVFDAPAEVSIWTNGIAQGRYEDKYKYCADFGTERVWGWSSVSNAAAGQTGQNIGIWHVLASAEYYNGGPMKPELMDAPMVNMLNGGHYYLGNDSEYGANEVWTRVQGPYFIYCNCVTNTLTNAYQTAEALFNDAQAQAQAEATAWPYYWFTNANYATASQRGVVSGQLVIADSGNPNATASNMWVGVVRQPVSVNGVYDFQLYMKPYQFWVKTDANGNFTIPNVIATNNYTLWAFGPGINGTFMSQSQSGNFPPILYSLPSTPFSVTVTAGATNNLGAVTWTNSSRVGATVFEIGCPDRTAKKFRHGDDWWVGDIGNSPTNPMPVWSKFLEYPFDFPSGPNYVVGQSRWSTDWNFIQPNVVDSQGNMNPSTSTITFNLATAPTNGATASLYVGLCSDDAGPLEIGVNGNNLVSGSGGVTATPTALPSTGYFPPTISSANSIGYDVSDTSIREGISAASSDERIGFPGSMLHAGQNTITINMRKGGSLDNHAMYDYIRLELTGYVPPPPASVVAYPGNNCNLVSWPVTPGATSYNVLRSTSSGSGYASITNGVIGPLCGSGYNNATYLDAAAANGTSYYYEIQSVNPGGSSASSSASSGATPNAGISISAPSAPTGLSVAGVGHHSVTLNWSAASGANYYSVFRSTWVNNGGGSSNLLGTIILNNTNTGTGYTDTSPTDGSIYSYYVTATSAGGTSGNSASAVGIPLPAPPAYAPASLTAYFVQVTNVLLGWSPVSGAVGYDIYRATLSRGPFYVIQSVTETNYTDVGLPQPSSTYYYRVAAVNAGGISPFAANTANGQQPAPVSLLAVAGNGQVTLTWSPAPPANGYAVQRGTSSGGESTYVVTGYSGTNYTDIGLTNGVTYYYRIVAQSFGGNSGFSPEASATLPVLNLTWSGASSGAWDDATTNWLNGATAAAYADGDNVTFNDTAQTNIVITGVVSPGSVTFANATACYGITTGGAGISGTNNLVKNNGGVLALNSANAYSGGTTVNGGALLANNATGSGTGSGAVTVNSGGTLGGAGSISGPVTVNAGGSFAPGNPLGTLTVNNNLTLASGSTTFAQVGHSPPTNNAVTVTGTLTEGGTLNVTNIALPALANGDSFQLFNAGTFAGTFSAYVLPALTPGLAWSTTSLNTNGALSVIAASTPVFTSRGFYLIGSNMVFSGTGGVAGANFYLLNATTLSTPFSNWTRLLTNQFDSNGNFDFTNSANNNSPQGFYLLQLP